MRKFIAVIGEHSASKENYRMAERVGELIAKNGAILICGALQGVMEAACKGAKSMGGLTVGILPGSKREEANPWVDIPVVTGVGYARNKFVVKSGHVVIAVGGSYGTLSEIAFALGYNIPVVGLNTWTFSQYGKRLDHAVKVAKTPEQAVEMALKIIHKKHGKKLHDRLEFHT